MSLTILLEQVVNGLLIGAAYALLGGGLALIYGTMRLFNFAQGEMYMLGGYALFFCLGVFGFPVPIAVLAATLFTFGVAAAIQRVALRPLVGQEGWTFSTIAVTLGLSIMLQQGAQHLFGDRPKTIPYLVDGVLRLGPVTLPWQRLLIFVVAVAVMGVLTILLKMTRLGQAIRAVAQDPEAAAVVGIPTPAIHTLVFALGSALGAVAATLLAPLYGITPWMGAPLGHQAFFGIGAYTSALLAKTFDLSPWLTVWVGGAVAAVFGFVLSLPVLRIRSMPHGAIVSLGFAEIVRIAIGNLRVYTRGEQGLFGIPSFDDLTLPWIGEVTFNVAEKTPYYYLMLALFIGGLAVLTLTMRSRIGLAVIAIRDAQDAAESLGVNLTRHKVLVFVLGAAIAGVCGAFYARYILVLTPRSVIGLDVMVLILAMPLVGGLGTFVGPVLGAFLLTFAGGRPDRSSQAQVRFETLSSRS